MADKKEIMIFDKTFAEFSLNLNKHFEEDKTLSPRVYNNIIKALKNGGVDSKGNAWISSEKLFHILRCKSNLQNYVIEKIEKKYKREGQGGTQISLCKVTSELMERKAKNPKNKYYNSILNALVEIENSPELELFRRKVENEKEKEIIKLKNKRKKKYKIEFDELTGEKLKKGAEFHHIRAKSIYPELSTNVENGLILNKETHNEITKNNINNEDELYEFCMNKNYNKDWYEKFKVKFE